MSVAMFLVSRSVGFAFGAGLVWMLRTSVSGLRADDGAFASMPTGPVASRQALGTRDLEKRQRPS